MDSREAFVALNMIDHVGPVRVRQLLTYLGDAPAILAASKQQLMRVQGIGEETAEAIASWEKHVDLANELKRIREFGCHVLIQTDEAYPELLRQIYDPPLVLYVKGTLTPQDKNAVAMVGSRMTTAYGTESARRLAYQLAYGPERNVRNSTTTSLTGATPNGDYEFISHALALSLGINF